MRKTWVMFLMAFLVALAVHLVFFSAFVLTVPGAKEDYTIGFFFLGGILRSHELGVMPKEEFQVMRVLSPSVPLGEYNKTWVNRLHMDKPLEAVTDSYEGMIVPEPFPTEHVVYDSQEDHVFVSHDVGVSEVLNMKLKLPDDIY